MMDNIELYLEEQREILKSIGIELEDLNQQVRLQSEKYVPPPTELVVKGQVEVNTEKSVAVSNLQELIDRLDEQTAKTVEAIRQHAPEPIDAVAVTNLNEIAIPDSLKVTNLDTLRPELERIKQAVEALDLNVVVQKQEVVFPTSPKKAIPVRLSDGKGFYTAVAQAIATGSSESDPLNGYQITDEITENGTKYYGFTNKHGHWYIMRVSSGAYRFCKGGPLATGGGLYTDAWTNRANLTYDYYYEVF